MDFDATLCPLAIVSTDTNALRELTWSLAAFGYHGLPSSDWSEQALWRRMYAPALVILDARDEPEIHAALSAPRTSPYTYRLALFDPNLLSNPDELIDLGADDLIRYPLDPAELIACLRRGTRRLEFERRFGLNSTFDQHRGVANRRGFTLQLDRKTEHRDDPPGGVLVVLEIDSLDAIRELHGATAVETACSLAAETVFGGLSTQDCRGVLADGTFAVHLHSKSASDGLLFAQEVNKQCAVVNGRGPCVSLSGVIVNWPGDNSAAVAIERAMAALEHVRGWGGGQVLNIEDVEREYEAWEQTFAGCQTTVARNAMEAFPLVLPLNPGLPASGLGVSSFAAGTLPACIPVVDDIGHLVGVVDGEAFQAQDADEIHSLEEHVQNVSATLRGDSRLDEIIASLDAVDSDYLLVVENKKPIGYITSKTVAALRDNDAHRSRKQSPSTSACELSSLVVPLI